MRQARAPSAEVQHRLHRLRGWPVLTRRTERLGCAPPSRPAQQKSIQPPDEHDVTEQAQALALLQEQKGASRAQCARPGSRRTSLPSVPKWAVGWREAY
eukprot:2316520-Pleurochrysis_carterae.AAC.1